MTNQNYTKFEKNNKLGLLDINKKEVLEPEYSEISQIFVNNEFFIITKYFDFYQIYTEDLKRLGRIFNLEEADTSLTCEEVYIYFINKFLNEKKLNQKNLKRQLFSYENKNGKFQLLNERGEVITKKEYDWIQPILKDKYILFEQNGKVGLLDDNGNEIFKPEYTQFSQIFFKGKFYIIAETFEDYQIYTEDLKKLGRIFNLTEINEMFGVTLSSNLEAYEYFINKFENK